MDKQLDILDIRKGNIFKEGIVDCFIDDMIRVYQHKEGMTLLDKVLSSKWVNIDDLSPVVTHPFFLKVLGFIEEGSSYSKNIQEISDYAIIMVGIDPKFNFVSIFKGVDSEDPAVEIECTYMHTLQNIWRMFTNTELIS